MNAWIWCADLLLLALFPCAFLCLRGEAVRRLVGFEMAGAIAALVAIVLAQGFHRLPFYDIGLTMALLAFGGGMVFARFLERWL